LKSKQAELLSDLTRLLKKYRARDWEPLIRLFSARPAVLLEVVATAEERAEKKKPRPSRADKKPAAKTRSTSLGAKTKSQQRPSTNKRVKQKAFRGSADATHRSALTKVPFNALQTLYVQAYNDKRVPKSRSEIIAALDAHIQKLSDSERSRFWLSLPNDSTESTETFRRWSEIISKPTREIE
jgi:hypothetical protein